MLLNIVPMFVAACVFVCGLIAAAHSRNRQAQLLPALAGSCILAAGLSIFDFTFADEFLVLCLLAGHLGTVRSAPRPYTIAERLHRTLFFTFALYLVLQSARGMLLLGSPRKVRWILFYLLVAALPRMLEQATPRPITRERIAYWTSLCGAWYFSAYVLYAVVCAILFDVQKFDLQVAGANAQAAVWGTSAYAMFPAGPVLAGALINVRARSAKRRWVAWMAIVSIVVAGLHYESRVAVLTLAVFGLVAVLYAGVRRTVVFGLIVVAWTGVFIRVIWPSDRTLSVFLDDVLGSGSSLWESGRRRGAGRDLNRTLYIQAGINTISDTRSHLLFGYGFRVSSSVVGGAMAELSSRHGGALTVVDPDSFTTEAFTELLVGTGWVGVGLLLANICCTMYLVWTRGQGRSRLLLLTCCLVMTGWLFVINMLDIMLFYLAIMPSGLLLRLAGGAKGVLERRVPGSAVAAQRWRGAAPRESQAAA